VTRVVALFRDTFRPPDILLAPASRYVRFIDCYQAVAPPHVPESRSYKETRG